MNDANEKLNDAFDPTAIVGHSDFTNALAAALASGRMHHAWLLTGPRGIGKASIARSAAAWYNVAALFGFSCGARARARRYNNNLPPLTCSSKS